ncbi:uncharacterized protein BO80DRAFT_426992 [Aspergillus ibericus CBS 121593]|uniref:Uncharacterized protein n=1 Tax=Aspergillus ibericus CBS 121593 TaxID=1448316 RepID=A0A395GV47_9EURO|nr:hypothetical protein BO80DRAFT_426992 [Aspergillus ibericus CBS 121593]RAK98888.1 hypothetical protein BO80DRAFT_426992 [Aspergillus ibericus CBS 121593]
MREYQRTSYDAVPVEEQFPDPSPVIVSPLHPATIESPAVEEKEPNKLQPQPLETSSVYRHLRLAFDIIVGSIALLFTIFGIWVYRLDGHPAGPGSTGSKLYNVSQYAPTIFPVLFAAVAGGSMKSIASWRIQTRRGATVGLLEQCLGSQTISGALLTQIRLGMLNVFAVLTIVLWCLSPLGSQASLRVISIVASYPSSPINLTTMNTFTAYGYGYAEGRSEAVTAVADPVIASIMAASLLGTRNQDLWGNVRFPAIEKNTNSEWMDILQTNNLSYASLVGTPVNNMASSGNTSFTLPGSYLSVSCSKFGISNETKFINYTSSDAPTPNNGVDCTWASSKGGTQYQIAISKPCSGVSASMASGTRPARKLIWESQVEYTSGDNEDAGWTLAECDLTTTYVDANVSCTGSTSGSSSASTCNLSSVRRSPTPQYNHNWTVFDFDNVAAQSVLTLLTGLFPYSQLSGGYQPIVAYLADPYHAVIGTTLMPTYTVGREVFEIRLAQLLNPVLYIGIGAPAFTGSYNASLSPWAASTLKIGANATIQQDVVQCSRAWLGVLILASVTIFMCAIVGAVLRFITLMPDVLGSISVAFLHNRTTDVPGSSTWSSDEWAKNTRDKTLYLGDVEPGAEVGCIALATSAEDVDVHPVKGRYYV